jgi:hypothetical protein
MATLQELENALVNADKAGDSTAAKILAREISNMRTLGTTQLGSSYTPRSQVVDPPSPGGMARIGRGLKDFEVAIQQRTLPKDEAEKLTKEQDAEIAMYEKGRGKDAGSFDAFRFIGNTAPTIPVGGAIGMGAKALGAASGPVARTVVGALQGGAQGATMYTPEGGSTGKQVALGMVGGAVAPWAADAIGTVVSKAMQFGKGAAARFAATPEAIVAELEPVLAKQGIKWGDLTQEVRSSMLAQAKRQLTVDGELSPDALARKVEMDDLMGPGAGPTRGQVMRERPSEWSFERNAQKLPAGIGEPLTERYQAQVQRLQDLARQAREAMGGRAQNAYQAGASATGAVQQKMDESKKVVDSLYDAFRSTGAGNVEVKAAPIATTLGNILDEHGVENIPSPVLNRLREFGLLDGQQKKVLTVTEAEKLRKLIGNNAPGTNSPTDRALTILKRSVDEAVIDTDAPGVPALKTARDAARDRFSMRDSAAGVTAAAKDSEPDRFFTKFVLNGNVRDLQGLKATLNTGVMGGKPTPGMQGYEPQGAQAWRDLKSQVVEFATEKAQADGEGVFSGKAFRKALDSIGDERLKVIFEPSELAQIRKLDRVAYNLTAEPNLAAVNHSNTAAAGAQYGSQAMQAIPRLADMATGIPLVGKMAAGAWSAGDDLARNAEMRKRVGRALTGEAFSPDARNAKYRQLAELISGRVSPYSAAAMGTGVSGYDGEKPW